MLEADRWENFNTELSQVGVVGVEGLLHLHRSGPGWKRVPAVTDHGETSNLFAHRLNGPQHALHRAPAQLAVPHIHHPIFLRPCLIRLSTFRIETVKQEGNHIAAERP